MKRMFIFMLIPVSHLATASDITTENYTVSTVYEGALGKREITMYLNVEGEMVSGKYMYDRFRQSINVTGVKKNDKLVLNEKLTNGSAVFTLALNKKSYQGNWCNDKCIPISLNSNTSFIEGEITGVSIKDADSGAYKVTVHAGKQSDELIINDSIEQPKLEFLDLNNDGFYDLVVRTDIRPSNGSQIVYISTKNGFIKDEVLSKVNGSFAYDYIHNQISFSSKEDCCNKYSKDIYCYFDGGFVLKDSLFFDYGINKGFDKNRKGISKLYFESY
jgi:hypothetical protein